MKTILQVEDDLNDVFFLKHALERAGVASSAETSDELSRRRVRTRRVRPNWDWRKAADLASLRARNSRARRLMMAPGTSLEREAALVPGWRCVGEGAKAR